MKKQINSIVEGLEIQRQEINEASKKELIDLHNIDPKKFDLLQSKCRAKGYEVTRFFIGVISKDIINPQVCVTPMNSSSNLPSLMLGWVEGKLFDSFQIVFNASIAKNNKASKQFSENEFRGITKLVLPLVSDLNKEKWEDYVTKWE